MPARPFTTMANGASSHGEAATQPRLETPRLETRHLEALRRRYAAAKAARAAWESRWQECYAMTLPLAGPANTGTNRVNSAEIPLFDGTAADAVEQLAASLLAQLTPPWSRWFAFQPGNDLDGHPEQGQAASLLDAASRRAQGHFDRSNFIVEMLLQPTSSQEGRLDAGLLRSYGAELDSREAGGRLVLNLQGRRLVSASAFWDPAYGARRSGQNNRSGGDGSVVAALFSDDDGRFYLHRIAYLSHDPARLTEQDAAGQLCDQVAALLRDLHLPGIRVETNGLGKFLPGLLRHALARIDYGAAVVEHVSQQAKAARILAAFDAPLAAGRLYAHDSVLASPLITEMREWRPGQASARDDGLDAVAGCLLAEPVRLGLAARPQRQDWRPGGGQHKAGADFDPFKS